MAKEQNISLTDNIVQLCRYVSSLAGNVLNLAVLEAQLAGKSIMVIIMLFFIGLIFLASAWLFLMTMLIMFISAHLSIMLTLFIVSMFNLLLIFPILLIAMKFSGYLKFSATRKHLSI